jgi:hypothetical protein
MRRVTILLAVVATVLLAISGYLLSELRSERGRASADAHGATTLRADLARLVETRERLENEVQTLRVANANACRDLAGAGGTGATTAAAIPGRVLPSSMPGGWRPPELSAEQRKSMSRSKYGALFRELALSEQQIDALLPVLAAQDQAEGQRRMHNGPGADAQTPDPERNRAEIAAVVGADKAAQFETLKKSLPARSQLAMLRMNLDQSGEPMTEEQRQKLLAIMTAREPVPMPPPLRVDGESGEQSFLRFRDWQQDRDRQMREDAASVLTPQQQKRLDEINAVQAAMRPATMSAFGSGVGLVGSGAAGSRPR